MLLVGVAAIVGCHRSNREGVEDATRLELGLRFKVRMDVPGPSVPMTKEHEQRIAAAGKRRDPEAKVEVVGREPSGGGGELVYLMAIEHSSAYAGLTLRDVAADTKTAAELGGRDRGMWATCDIDLRSRHVDVDLTIRGPQTQMNSRARMFVVEGHLLELGCFASGIASPSLATCALPATPPDALLVDQPIGAPH